MNSTRNLFVVASTFGVIASISLMVDYTVNPVVSDEIVMRLNEATSSASALSQTTDEPDTVAFPPRRGFFAWTPLLAHDYLDQDEWSHVPTHASFVRINDRIDHWLLGTPIEILIPQTDMTFHAKVDAIRPNGTDSMTIFASPDSNEHDLQRLILTYGSDHVLGYLTARTNNWEINGDGEIAWIVSGDKLKRSKDFSKEDVIHREVYRYANAEYLPKQTE